MMDEPEMDFEFCYYSGSDEDESPVPLINEHVDAIRDVTQDDVDMKIERINGEKCFEIKSLPSNPLEVDSIDDSLVASEDDSDDESTSVKRSTGRQRKAIVSMRCFRKNIRRLSRHQLKRCGKQKSQKEREGEKENEKERETKEERLREKVTKEEKENETKRNGGERKEKDIKDLLFDTKSQNEIENSFIFKQQKISELNVLAGDDQPEIRSRNKRHSDIEWQIKNEIVDLTSNDEQEEVFDRDAQAKEKNSVDGNGRQQNKTEMQQNVKHNTKLQKKNGIKFVTAEQQKSNEVGNKDSPRGPQTRQAKVKMVIDATKTHTRPVELGLRTTRQRGPLYRPLRDSQEFENLTITPIGDSTTAYKDSIGHIYQKKMTYPSSIYMKCRYHACPVSLTYNTDSGTARLLGVHIDRPLRTNQMQLVEMSQLARSKAYDSTQNHLTSHKLYDNCVAEFEGIELPVGHYEKTIEAIQYHRKRAEQKRNPKEAENIDVNEEFDVTQVEDVTPNVDQVKSKNGSKGAEKIVTKPTQVATTARMEESTKAKLKNRKKFVIRAFEPLAGSETLFKDTDCNIYRKITANSKVMYLKCGGTNCAAGASYNMLDKTVHFTGDHTNHPTSENSIRLIEFANLLRSRALDPKYKHVKTYELYNQCIAEFKGIQLPENHLIQSHIAINNCRKRIQNIRKKDPNANFNLNESLKMNTVIPKILKRTHQTPTKINQTKSPKKVIRETRKKSC